jgi:hypothetical protein
MSVPQTSRSSSCTCQEIDGHLQRAPWCSATRHSASRRTCCNHLVGISSSRPLQEHRGEAFRRPDGAARRSQAGAETPGRPAREISWEISGASVATGIFQNVGFAGDCKWARLDSNQGPTDYESDLGARFQRPTAKPRPAVNAWDRYGTRVDECGPRRDPPRASACAVSFRGVCGLVCGPRSTPYRGTAPGIGAAHGKSPLIKRKPRLETPWAASCVQQHASRGDRI